MLAKTIIALAPFAMVGVNADRIFLLTDERIAEF
jgi:hypothetical protein